MVVFCNSLDGRRPANLHPAPKQKPRATMTYKLLVVSVKLLL
jgi:hypothetical protein